MSVGVQSQHSIDHVTFDNINEDDPQQDYAFAQDDLSDDGWTPGTGDDNFKVVIRIRPPLPRELRGTGLRPYQCTTDVDAAARHLTLSENLPAVINGAPSNGMLYATYRFTFDHVYDQSSTQQELYSHTAQQVVLSILQGYNAAIVAYGQTGTGKTYTMEGDLEGPHRGIIPRTVEDIFTYIVNDPEPTSKYLVRASYLQIYNEVISDLLKPERTNLIIREDRRRGVFVEGLSEWVVRSPGEVYQLMTRGQSLRATGATKLNEVSSRSHAVCIVIVEKCTSTPGPGGANGQGGTPASGMMGEEPGMSSSLSASWSRPSTATGTGPGTSGGPMTHSIKVGKLNLVDLAGSERVHVTGAVGKRLEESKKINASLSALGNVIAALTDRKERSHIPYRDSKLTRILEDSLGGNCKTTMICTVAPAMDAFQESLSTLKFANRAKNIKNEAHVNEDLDQRTLLRKYERELRKLRAELTRRSRELVDKRHLLEVEEQKKRAEADKLAALTALEKRSREFLREKEEKRQLEHKISAMQSQLLVGGSALEDVPAFRALLAREHRRIRGEYEARLRELESERESVQEDRAQVDRYKQLLLKQRDIMIALTARLNERDEQIMALQEELEAYDKYGRQLEDALDGKTAELIALRRAAVEHSAASPINAKSAPLQSALGLWSSQGGAEGRGGLPGGPGTSSISGGGSDDLRAGQDTEHTRGTAPSTDSRPSTSSNGLQHINSAGGLQTQSQGGRGDGHSYSNGLGSGGGGGYNSGNRGSNRTQLAADEGPHGGGATEVLMPGFGAGPGSFSGEAGQIPERSASGTPGSPSVSPALVAELVARLDNSESALAALRDENLRLTAQLSSAAGASSSSGRSGDEQAYHISLNDAAEAVELSHRVEVLSGACRTAQKERAALQQILEVKVKRMMSDLIQEEANLAATAQGAQQNPRTLSRLRALDSVLDKVSDAIRCAPPIAGEEVLVGSRS